MNSSYVAACFFFQLRQFAFGDFAAVSSLHGALKLSTK